MCVCVCVCVIVYFNKFLESSFSVRAPKAQAMVELIQQFGELSGAIDRLARKDVGIESHIPTDDFPKEVSERMAVVSTCDR